MPDDLTALIARVEAAECEFRRSLETIAMSPEFQAAMKGLSAAGSKMAEAVLDLGARLAEKEGGPC